MEISVPCGRYRRQDIDFLLTAKRDATAALRFFRKAIRHHGTPDDATIAIRQSKYLNNLVEQEHRNIKRRIKPMLGFKSFRRTQALLAGIELVHMIRKEQYQHPDGEGLSPADQFYLSGA